MKKIVAFLIATSICIGLFSTTRGMTVETTPNPETTMPVLFTLEDREQTSRFNNKGSKELRSKPFYKVYLEGTKDYFLYRRVDNCVDIIKWETQNNKVMYVPDMFDGLPVEQIILTELSADTVTLADGIKTFEVWHRKGDLLNGKPYRDSYYAGIKSINVGKSFNQKPKTFGWWLGLKNINVSAENATFASRDGVLFSKDGKTLQMYPLANGKNYVVPRGTKKIVKSAFENSIKLQKVIIPGSVKNIKNRTFYNCPNLKEIVIKGKKTTLSKKCGISYYYDSTSLKQFRDKGRVTIIAPYGSKAHSFAKDNGFKFKALM